jgi:uncharacterized protein (TIGR02001 family)
MLKTKHIARLAAVAGALALPFGGSASAAEFGWSVTIGGTSDYVFRGVSQTEEDPAFQAAVDANYGIAYVGIWGSGLDFGGNAGGANTGGDATAEIDLYAGIKPVWEVPVWGPVTLDFGVIYYAYPNATDSAAELNYVELKAGYSVESPWIKGLTSGTTVFWSPDYTNEQGDVVTLESVASYALPQVGVFSPSISGTWGAVYGDLDDGFVAANGSEDYQYWNAGLTLDVEKISFDFRYWDTDISDAGGFCNGATFQCDERFVFSASVSLP